MGSLAFVVALRVRARLRSFPTLSDGSQEVHARSLKTCFNCQISDSSAASHCQLRPQKLTAIHVAPSLHAAYINSTRGSAFWPLAFSCRCVVLPLAVGWVLDTYLTRTQQPTQSPDETVELVAGTTRLTVRNYSSWARPRARNPRTR